MKARIRKTNEIIDVEIINPAYRDKDGVLYNDAQIDIMPNDLWEERHWEAAKACLVGIIANARFNINLDIGDKAEQAVNYADALINELKKQDNDKG